MKKLSLFIATAVLGTIAAAAGRPILVGHRGSQYGLENSVESFTNGAKLGYEYLETDWKLTKDKQFVCTHDDNTTRLGGTKDIATSTLAELQSETLSQTRSGVKYTGRLCSAQEYLDVCKEFGVRPLIELKWTTGINNNDCSNIPLLIKFIEDNGFRNKCIILTSMKPCLEYIRANYPDIELQFLTGQYWASHFDWCVEKGIDVDIQSGYFDKSTVTKYHDKGLKVNMWTTNTNDGYKTYGNMGCDMITTDYLDPANLPELDPSVTFPPNTTDYPNTSATPHGSYKPEKVAEIKLPLAATNAQYPLRVIAKDNMWIELWNSYPGHWLKTTNAITGEASASLYTFNGIEGEISDIALTADGVLIGSTHATVPFAGGGEVFRIYAWDSPTASPRLIYSADTTPYLGNWTNAVVGDHIAVSGTLKDLKIYIASLTASGAAIRIAGIHLKNGVVDGQPVFAESEEYSTHSWTHDFTMQVTPTSRDCILITSPTMQPVEYRFNWDQTRVAMEETAHITVPIVATKDLRIGFYRHGTKAYALIPSADEDGFNLTATLYDVTSGLDNAVPLTAPIPEEPIGATGRYAPAWFITTAITNIDNRPHLLVYGWDDKAVTYALEAANGSGDDDTPAEVDLELTRLWIQSNTTGNHPGDIDGTNAQQGTAVNGLFYVNNCAESLIHVFNETGHLGTMPGGSGWGCARDDAGNIIVRNDKLTADTHAFLVYPAGSTPDNHGEPLAFTATVKMPGQCNFINAGGDILGGIGHIYMYPNGQNAVNILTVSKGNVVASTAATDLQMAGSTAGYVVPVGDDTENFLYQVRTSGIYFYNGGTNNALSTDRTTTTAPGRNSTGGAAYFSIAGNKILVHNSGANYKGGFTVRNMTTSTVVDNIAPIGALGYEAGGNYSTFNWLIPEKVSDKEWRIYQYCPANGIAVYSLKNKLGAVENIISDAPDTDAPVELYDLNGRRAGSNPTPGIYIRRQGNSVTKIVIR